MSLDWCLMAPRMAILLVLFVPAECNAQPHPSAALLIDSWRAVASAFPATIHSYHLEGKWERTSQIDNARIDHAVFQWTAVHDGVRLRYQVTKDGEAQALAYDGHEWNSLQRLTGDARGQVIYRPESLFDTPMTQQYDRGDVFPYDMGAMLRDPTRSFGDVSRPDQYAGLTQSMAVSGPENVNGRACYHLRLLGAPPKDPTLPTDVWIADDGGRLVPWQLQIVNRATTGAILNRFTTSFLASATFGRAWYPVAFRCQMEAPTSNGRWAEVFRADVNLSLTDINRSFNAGTFHLTFPPGAVVSVQDPHSGAIREVYRVGSVDRRRWLIITLLAVGAVSFAAIRYRRLASRHSKPPYTSEG